MKMKRVWMLWLISVLVFGFSVAANATLTTIGTATYGGTDYKLIYEDDSIYGGLVWMDYTKGGSTWQSQVDWASGLGGSLTVNLYPGYTTDIDWSTGWRLPLMDGSKILSAGDGYEGPDVNGFYDYTAGYNMVNSEMGHLFYESLGNLGWYATDGTFHNPDNPYYFFVQNMGDFDHIEVGRFWSGTEYSTTSAWEFGFFNGYQLMTPKGWDFLTAMAVHQGYVSTAVPEPATLLLLGSGMVGLAGFRRKLKK